MGQGRTTSYTEEYNQAAKDYLENFSDNEDEAIPSAVGMAISLGIAKSTLYKWGNDGYGDISNTLAQCQDKQHLTLINKGLKNEFNPTIVKLALANHGYSEKTETSHTGTIGLEAYELNETERSARIASLLNAARGRRDEPADNGECTDMDTTGGSTD